MAQELKVVVPTHNRVDLLRRTLDSLAGCRLPAIYSGTIVVENSPRQLAHDIVEACPETLRARYLYVSRPNKSHALNEALAEVPDETLIYFIDDDIRLSTNVLDNYAKAAEGIDGGVFFGGPFRVDCEQDPPEISARLGPRLGTRSGRNRSCIHLLHRLQLGGLCGRHSSGRRL